MVAAPSGGLTYLPGSRSCCASICRWANRVPQWPPTRGAADGTLPPGSRFARILDCLGRFAGRPLQVDEKVYRSEAATGDRNRALAYLMRGSAALRGDPTEAVKVYFRQCAVKWGPPPGPGR